MKPLRIDFKKNFIGRNFELESLKKIGSSGEASIIVVYGRRRVGKTELLEQAFRERNLLKFEGIEGLNEKAQFINVMNQLAKYLGDTLISKVVIETWSEFFQLLAKYLQEGKWTLYLEELQWLANYKSRLVSELKYVWDNYFRHNPNLIIVLCGSAPSFMLEQVVHSKALYNRSQYEMHLKEFTLQETKAFLKERSHKEILDAYLTVGGIPEYLKWVNKDSSIFLGLCKNSFVANSFFLREYEKIFTSSMAKNSNYRKVIEILSKERFSTRKALLKMLKMESGGSLSSLLLDLEKSGFIIKYHPFNLSGNTLLVRYAISDAYLYYYHKFIKPIQENIENGEYNEKPMAAIKVDNYSKWLGFAFERFVRKNHMIIAKILGFSGVQYKSGVYFNRSTDKDMPGYQIDLIFDRADNIYTICEIKYLQGKVSTKVIQEFERKLSLFPQKSNKTIQKILICNEGVESALFKRHYFDQVITTGEFFA